MLAKTYSQRPSRIIQIEDRWAAYQFDQAIMLVGTAIDNALQETHNVGSEDKPKYELKYKLADLLDPEFRFINEDSFEVDMRSLGNLDGMHYDEV